MRHFFPFIKKSVFKMEHLENTVSPWRETCQIRNACQRLLTKSCFKQCNLIKILDFSKHSLKTFNLSDFFDQNVLKLRHKGNLNNTPPEYPHFWPITGTGDSKKFFKPPIFMYTCRTNVVKVLFESLRSQLAIARTLGSARHFKRILWQKTWG